MTPIEYYIPSAQSAAQQPQPAIALAMNHYISKLANMAKIDTKVESLAIDITRKTDDPHLLGDGKAPNGLAAAYYIYLASNTTAWLQQIYTLALRVKPLQRHRSHNKEQVQRTHTHQLQAVTVRVTVRRPAQPRSACVPGTHDRLKRR
jgi:transcription initiation factor TFIIIB Brf1 subunit/transcription initiation factor TFIIB